MKPKIAFSHFNSSFSQKSVGGAYNCRFSLIKIISISNFYFKEELQLNFQWTRIHQMCFVSDFTLKTGMDSTASCLPQNL
jgi:hypothetical protein